MIQPIGKNIYIQMDEVKKVGNLVTENKRTIHESGKVIAIGKDVTLDLKPGDTILVKGWAIDSITYDKQDYFFINEDSGAICAVIT